MKPKLTDHHHHNIFDTISPIRARDSEMSVTRVADSIEFIDMLQEDTVWKCQPLGVTPKCFKQRRNQNHSQNNNNPKPKQKHPFKQLTDLYIKRLRYPFQLLKQFVIFSESDASSLAPFGNYGRDGDGDNHGAQKHQANHHLKYHNQQNIEDGCATLAHVVESQNQKAKIMAFEKVRFLFVHQINVSQIDAVRWRQMAEKVGKFMEIVNVVMKRARKGLLNCFSQKLREYCNTFPHAFSRILTPVTPNTNRSVVTPVTPTNSQHNPLSPHAHLAPYKQITQTTRKTSRSALSAGGSYKSQQLQRQFIYIVKTSSTQRLDGGKRRSVVLKVPLVAGNVVINQVSLEGESIKSSRRRGNGSSSSKGRNRENSKEAKCSGKGCVQCRYCSMFDNMKLWEEPVSMKKARAPMELPTHRKRVFLN